MKIEYAIVIKSKTRLESLIERFNTKAQAKFYIERSGGNFNDYEEEHTTFYHSLERVQQQLSSIVKFKIVDRQFISSFIFSKDHVVIVVGQDGLVANVAKYVNKIPIIGINPDMYRNDGVLLPFNKETFVYGLNDVLNNAFTSNTISLAEAKLNDGQRLLAFNDLFIGPSSHVSARYMINYNGVTERHSSSGIIVSTKAGSTGWLSSIINMSYGIQNFINKGPVNYKKRPVPRDGQLIFVVREPFLSKISQVDITAGVLTLSNKLVLESLMPTGGIIFSDGIEKDFLNFNSGSTVTIGIAEEKAILVTNKTANS